MLTRDADPFVSSSTTGDAGTNIRWLLGESSLPAHIDPDRLALRWGSTDVTYGELRARGDPVGGRPPTQRPPGR